MSVVPAAHGRGALAVVDGWRGALRGVAAPAAGRLAAGGLAAGDEVVARG